VTALARAVARSLSDRAEGQNEHNTGDDRAHGQNVPRGRFNGTAT
jgi:hypothetical protein